MLAPSPFDTAQVGHPRRLLRSLAIFPLRSFQIPSEKKFAEGEGFEPPSPISGTVDFKSTALPLG
jgi:hypothetical protein